MMKTLTYLILICLIGFVNLKAQVVNEVSVITWPFDLGSEGQVATYSEGTSIYYSSNWVGKGANLKYKDVSTNFDVDYTRFQPVTESASVDETNLVSFNFRPSAGLGFMPKTISFDCMRYGTDGGKIDVEWKSSDGTKTKIATDLVPARNNSAGGTHATFDLSELIIPPSTGDCALYIYINSLGSSKQVGLANIIIEGDFTGTVENVSKYSLDISALPAEGGSVACVPVGTVFDEGTSLTVLATRSFGYEFSHWTSDGQDIISENSSYTFNISQETILKAVFNPINTYSLRLNTSEVAENYMVLISPLGVIVDEQRMYEEGTTVTLTAYDNPILTFTNWSTGETNSTMTLQMTRNIDVAASYSALDYIVGWDFYKTGGTSRPADFFSTSDNQVAMLVLRKPDGTLNSWLDKSNMYLDAPYNSDRGAAVIWKPVADQYYYQTSFSATDFENIHVSAGISYGFNAYTTQYCQYSLDGIDFTTVGTYIMPDRNIWYDNTFILPSDTDHADKVYIRWIPDYTSAMNGTPALDNDGTSISNIFITATTSVFDDGLAPDLVGSVPSANAVNASATGKIVLTFDEKVMLVDDALGLATLNSKQLTPAISGKTITFSYSGLEYGTDYTFTLPSGSVSDLSGNILVSPITITFTTMTRPTVVKKPFDFIVGVDGDFKEALSAATSASSSGDRFRIFFPRGEYNIGSLTGDDNQKTSITLSNISFIGEKDSSVVLYNAPATEGIGVTATLAFTNTANNIYMQDMSLMNKLDYRSGTFSGRAVALQDQGTKNIYKNMHLLSNQDTYYSGGGRIYFEGGSIHGTVDFICGGGDVFFNESLLYLENRTGNCIAAPSTTSEWGYVFSNCTIDGFEIANGNFNLGRPWKNSPKSVYINTTMKILPSVGAWGDLGTAPTVFAEYNSITADGTLIDLSQRRTNWSINDEITTINPVLTADQAAQYTIENVLGGNDTWQPKRYTEQAPIPVVSYDGTKIEWNDSDYVLCWGIFKNGEFVEFITANSYNIPSDVLNGTVYTVRAANEMGGLSANSNEIEVTGSASANTLTKTNVQIFPNPVNDIVNILMPELTNDSRLTIYSLSGGIIFSTPLTTERSEFNLSSLPSGSYIFQIVSGNDFYGKRVFKK